MDESIKEAIQRVQNMRDGLNDEYDLPDDPDGEDYEEAVENMDSEVYGRYREAEATFDRVLDVLQLLALGITPAQGEPIHALGLDDDAQDHLDRRSEVGRDCIARAYGNETTWDELHEDDRETYARDAISDILTALYGPAGTYRETAVMSGNWTRHDNDEACAKALALLDGAMRSYEGDAEDYTITAS